MVPALYSKQNTVTDAALKHMESLPTMDNLDTEPAIEKLSKVITEMASKHHVVTAYRRSCFVNASPVYYLSCMTF